MTKRIIFFLKQGDNRDALNLKKLHPEEKESILHFYQLTGCNSFTWDDVFGVNSLLGQRWKQVKVGDKVAIDKWSLPYATVCYHSFLGCQFDDAYFGKIRRRITEITAIDSDCYRVKDCDYPFDFSSRISKGTGHRTCQLTLLLPKEIDKLLALAEDKPAQSDINELPLLALLKG